MADVTVPTSPVLVTIPRVELVQAGTWDISTGTWTATPADLAAAVAALDCPAVRRPVLKLGHTDPRFDGEPAVGWVADMSLADDGSTLIGDYTGLPAWLGDILASAYPDRSIEGQYDFRCQIGHTHPFVLTGVALLGVTPPGVGTLTSLQDVAALYGIAAAQAETGSAFRVPVTASGAAVPEPTRVAAQATTEDVRRSFYEGPAASNWWWIEEMFVDPTELIAMDDDSGKLLRVPYTVAADGTVSFGDPQDVKRTYVNASRGMREPVASWASKTESRPSAAAPHDPPADRAGAHVAAGDTTTQEARSMDLLTSLRQSLGLAEDADEATVLAAHTAALEELERLNDAQTPPPAALPSGTVAIDESALAELKVAASRGTQAWQTLQAQERDRLLGDAVKAGKFAPARYEHWQKAFDADPDGVRASIASLAEGLVPVEASGYDGGTGETPAPLDDSWFPQFATRSEV